PGSSRKRATAPPSTWSGRGRTRADRRQRRPGSPGHRGGRPGRVRFLSGQVALVYVWAVSELARFLELRRGELLPRWAAAPAPAAAPGSPLGDHLARLLGDLVASLAQGAARSPRPRPAGVGADALGPRLQALAGLILDELERAGAGLSLADARVLTGFVTSALVVSAADDQVMVRQQAGALAEQLRTSEERYRTLFASIDDAFCLIEMIVDERGETRDYRFLETNAAFEGQTGLKDAVGRTALELVPGLDGFWFQVYGEVAATGVTRRLENHTPAMSRWFDVYASRVGPPERRQVAVVFKDITARKLAEQARDEMLAREQAARAEAEAERQRQHDLFMQTPVAIAILEGPEHTFTFANNPYRALIQGRDVLGKPLHEALPDVKDQG
ncbi:MAG: PAS domain-containing protein, partial [Myxococcales bacterium]